MSNKELLIHFMAISQNSNIFDICCELKKFKKQYKTSDFYKITKMPIDTAYKMYISTKGFMLYNKLDNWLEPEFLSDKINEVINGIDEEKLQNLMNKITQVFNLDNLDNEKGELKQLINNLKILN